uniref:Uncharacterized protein n=1 Tax=Arundo donax TaxID=35708 RepID=A0A0A8YVW8_ARUDO
MRAQQRRTMIILPWRRCHGASMFLDQKYQCCVMKTIWFREW